MSKSERIDLGGNDLIVRSIRLADKPHQEGTPVDLGGGSIPDPLTVDELNVEETVTLGDLSLSAEDMEAVVAGAEAAHSHSLQIDIDGTSYWIMLSDTNANE